MSLYSISTSDSESTAMFVQLGNYCVTLHKMQQIENIYLGTCYASSSRRRRYSVTKAHDIFIQLLNEKKPLKVFSCKNQKEANRKLAEICRIVNAYIGTEEKLFDHKIAHIEDKMNKLFNAPGMPGYIEAQRDFELMSATCS